MRSAHQGHPRSNPASRIAIFLCLVATVLAPENQRCEQVAGRREQTGSGKGLSASALRQTHERIMRHLDAGEFSAAAEQLQRFEQSAPEDFRRNNYDYLLGRVWERIGRLTDAQKVYEQVLARRSVLGGYALWHLAGIARTRGMPAAEQAVLRRLVQDYPTSLLRERAEIRLTESLFESGSFADAIRVAERLTGGRGSVARRALLRTALARKELNLLNEARADFQRLIESQRDDVALRAARALDALDRQAGRTLTAEDHLRRGTIYQLNRAYAEARAHFQRLIEQFPTHPARREVLWEIGRGYFQERQFNEARRWFARLHDEFPGSEQGQRGFYYIGHALARAGRFRDAVVQYERFMAQYPASNDLPRAYLNTIDAWRSVGEDEEALRWCHRTQARFPGTPTTAAMALFSQVRIHLARNNLEAALAGTEELLRQNLPRSESGGPNHPEVLYLRGWLLEALGRLEEAVTVYLSLPDQRTSYWGQRATERLALLASDRASQGVIEHRFDFYRKQAKAALTARQYEKAKIAALQALRLTRTAHDREDVERMLRAILGHLPEYNRLSRLRRVTVARNVLTMRDPLPGDSSPRTLAGEFLFLGLADEGAPELAAAFSGPSSGSSRGRGQLHSRPSLPALNQAYTLAVYYHRGGHAAAAQRIADAALAPLIPADLPLELLPEEFARLLYPTPYAELLAAEAEPRGVDPSFMLALMRQESRFDPSAKSPAAARGLMQLIPQTAHRLARHAGLSSLEEDDLYRPEVSVRLAALLLEELMGKFQGNPWLVAAAYNAGEDNAERWLARARSSDPDRFVWEIAFAETKVYVYRVMANYRAYCRLSHPRRCNDYEPGERKTVGWQQAEVQEVMSDGLP